jgi:hypothetical protein
MELQLRISEEHNSQISRHLYPGDGKESVAIALCGRFSDSGHDYLLVHELTLIEDVSCFVREDGQLTWPTEKIVPYFHRILKDNMAILKIHSHPGGYNEFSEVDDRSDAEFFNSVFGWTDSNAPHASAVMLPDGKIFGRFFYPDSKSHEINKILIGGESLLFFNKQNNEPMPDYALRTIQAFGAKTFQKLNELKIGIVGCSGTGSPTIEQLTRLGVGKLVLVDPDNIETKNLNRIINSKKCHAQNGVAKVAMFHKAIKEMGFGTEVEIYQSNLYDDISAIRALISCDVIFGCIDSVDGRHILNQLSTFYIVPYIDLGVKLEADGNGGIQKICGTVHFIQPGKSSLISRGLYDTDDLRAAGQFRKNQKEYENLRKNAYIKNVNVDSPAVISVNMQISSHGVNEFLNRLHTYKAGSPGDYAQSTIDITENYIVNVEESNLKIDHYLRKKLGRGDVLPFLEMSEVHDEAN